MPENTKREPAEPQGRRHLAGTASLCNTGTPGDFCISRSRSSGEWARRFSDSPGPSHPAPSARTRSRTDAAPAGGPALPTQSANAAPQRGAGSLPAAVPRAEPGRKAPGVGDVGCRERSSPPPARPARLGLTARGGPAGRPRAPPRGIPQGARNLRAAPLSGGSGSRRFAADEAAREPPGSRPPLHRRPGLRAHPPAEPPPRPPAPTSKKPALPPILRAAAAPSPASCCCRSGGDGPAAGSRGERERPAPPRRAPPLLAPPRRAA